MDIYFCDLCGARVSDIDLRGGHGIRKQYDVICANCLELGHGKDWLAKHQRTRPASAAGVVKAPSVKVMAASPTIDAARDRVRTLEEGDMTPAVPVKVVAADDSLEDDASAGELEAEEAASSDTPAPGASSFAAAASGFSALGAQQPKSGSASHDDLADVDALATGDGQLIAEAASPFELDAQAESKADQAREEAETDDGHGGRRGRMARDISQKDETLPVDRPMVVAPEEKGGTGRKSSSSTAKSSAKNSKSGIKPSGKSGRKPKKNNNIYIMTGLSIAILTMIMLIIVAGRDSTKKERVEQKIELSESVKRAISDAKVGADSALRTKVKQEMRAALDKIQAIRPKIDEWEAEADKLKWTDEEKGLYMERIGWPATASRIRLLNDEIVKAGGGN